LIRENLDEEELNELNARVRKKILEAGEFYIVQTVLNGKIFLRNTMMNPFTEKNHMVALLNKIVAYSNS
jgi:L-2,4-diaminobutyrate decarboxylase